MLMAHKITLDLNNVLEGVKSPPGKAIGISAVLGAGR